MARDAFATFIPISVDSDARTKIVFDFFDLLAAIAAHGKSNGLSGLKLSRLAGWWAFEQVDVGSGFDGGYKSWSRYVSQDSDQSKKLIFEKCGRRNESSLLCISPITYTRVDRWCQWSFHLTYIFAKSSQGH